MRHILSNVFGCVRVSVLKIGIDRQRRRRDDLAKVIEHHVSRNERPARQAIPSRRQSLRMSSPAPRSQAASDKLPNRRPTDWAARSSLTRAIVESRR